MAFQLDTFNKLLLETVGVGLVIASYPDLRVVFRNHLVAEWFPDTEPGAESLEAQVPGLDAKTLRATLEQGKTYNAKLEVKVRRRLHALSLAANRADLEAGSWIIVELHNVTKVRELESMISSYSGMVERQNRMLKKEKERAEKLLLNIMPESVYQELKTFGVTTPQRFDEASILMLDFVGFTQMSIEHDPTTIVSELNDIFTAFDRIAEHQGCERIKTMGDAYVAVAGLPEANPDHAQAIARLALLCLRYLNRRNESQQIKWRCRIGLAPGPVIGSVIGIQKYVYDIFGPGINLAARLEALAGPMEILFSQEMQPLLHAQFEIEERGEAEVRGFGPRRIYRLTGAEDLHADGDPLPPGD